jgi:hypothetical protein
MTALVGRRGLKLGTGALQGVQRVLHMRLVGGGLSDGDANGQTSRQRNRRNCRRIENSHFRMSFPFLSSRPAREDTFSGWCIFLQRFHGKVFVNRVEQ